MKIISSLSAIAIAFVLLTSFSKKDSNPEKLPKLIDKSFAFVPNGAVELEGNSVDVSALYMSRYEVTNRQYAEFIQDLKNEGKADALQVAMLDTAAWISGRGLNAPYAEHYHKHPAYAEYPVVNVTKEGAELYCEWLEQKLNAAQANSEFQYEVRLPTRAEWVRSANADLKNSPYAWGGPYLQNAKGQVLCNYMAIGDASISYNEESGAYEVIPGQPSMGVAGYLNDAADVTCPVTGYAPSNFGLYNMNGNVAELTSEGLACGGSWKSPGYDVRNLSYFETQGAAPNVGFRPMLTLVKK